MRVLYGKSHRRLHKLLFYVRHAYLDILPASFRQKNAEQALALFHTLPDEQQDVLLSRVNYCNKLSEPAQLSENATLINNFTRRKPSSYYYDLLALLRYFSPSNRFSYRFGDITAVPDEPSFVKSRPIGKNNENAVLLKLNSARHFYIYSDKLPFYQKKQQLVWRGAAHQPQRIAFLKKYFDHPSCNVGSVNSETANHQYHRDYLSIAEQLRYRYILSIEGNDVATNLKWILASNSLCFMTTPRYETWLMEGRLKPDFHYVHVKDDYSDLIEKITFYNENPTAAEVIIKNANAYMRPFLDKEQERLVSLLVMQKYFKYVE